MNAALLLVPGLFMWASLATSQWLRERQRAELLQAKFNTLNYNYAVLEGSTQRLSAELQRLKDKLS